MTDNKPKRRPVKQLLDAFERVTAARLVLVLGLVALILVHGLSPKGFDIDGTTLGLLGFVVVLVLVPLLKSAKLPGGASLEFREILDTLKTESDQAETEQQKLAAPDDAPRGKADAEADEQAGEPGLGSGLIPSQVVGRESDVGRATVVVAEVLREAARSPRVGLIVLSGALEGEVHELLLSTGWATQTSSRTLRDGVARLVEVGVLTASAASALSLFSSVRNEIVHGRRTASDAEILRAIDAGITLLLTVAAIPRERNTVLHPGVEVYSDADGVSPINGVLGLLLKTENPTRTEVSTRIYPTTKSDYEVGKRVAWEWGVQQWGEAWYRDPESGQMKEAWTGSLEFVGRQFDEPS